MLKMSQKSLVTPVAVTVMRPINGMSGAHESVRSPKLGTLQRYNQQIQILVVKISNLVGGSVPITSIAIEKVNGVSTDFKLSRLTADR